MVTSCREWLFRNWAIDMSARGGDDRFFVDTASGTSLSTVCLQGGRMSITRMRAEPPGRSMAQPRRWVKPREAVLAGVVVRPAFRAPRAPGTRPPHDARRALARGAASLRSAA